MAIYLSLDPKIMLLLKIYISSFTLYIGYRHGQANKKSNPLHYNFEVFHEINVKVSLNETIHRCKCIHVKGPYMSYIL
jgi:hypothetical protein